MTLFDEFKENVPSNDVLCKQAADIVLEGKSNGEIKRDFSSLFEKMQEEIYSQYLVAQEQSGQKVIDKQIDEVGTVKFTDMDKLLMSIFQSRKSRAGKAFEYIIKEFFTRLAYPFSEQVDIDGAKPDFVMPSESYFKEKPLDSIIFTAKRTLRERWRQVVTEANKGYGYFLTTLDDKVTKSQIEQASKHKIFLVVPESIKKSNDVYANEYNVLSFEQFFADYLDPAMKRWNMKIAESAAPEYKSDQKSLF
jgi:restriction endonuclease EcoRII-like protein